jgi:hypothetical protein
MTTAYEVSFMIHDTLVPGHEYTVLSLSPISAWALLFAGKDVENQPYSTTQRGRVLIHASNEGSSLRESQARRIEVSFLSGLGLSALPTIFPRGTILGSVEIIDCIEDARSKWAVPGRYHWVLRDPRSLFTPIEDIEGTPQFWQWTHQPKPKASSRPRRAPSRSGIVPAVRAPGDESAQRAPTRKRSS